MGDGMIWSSSSSIETLRFTSLWVALSIRSQVSVGSIAKRDFEVGMCEVSFCAELTQLETFLG